MKKKFSIFLILFSSLLFSQKKGEQEIKITSENLKKAIFVKDIVPEFTANFDVLSAEYTFSKKGILCQEVTNGNEIPKSILNYTFKKGAVIFIDLKVKEDDNSKELKILSFSKKIKVI